MLKSKKEKKELEDVAKLIKEHVEGDLVKAMVANVVLSTLLHSVDGTHPESGDIGKLVIKAVDSIDALYANEVFREMSDGLKE